MRKLFDNYNGIEYHGFVFDNTIYVVRNFGAIVGKMITILIINLLDMITQCSVFLAVI